MGSRGAAAGDGVCALLHPSGAQAQQRGLGDGLGGVVIAASVDAASAIFGTVMYFVERGRPAVEPRPGQSAGPAASVRFSPTGLLVNF